MAGIKRAWGKVDEVVFFGGILKGVAGIYGILASLERQINKIACEKGHFRVYSPFSASKRLIRMGLR